MNDDKEREGINPELLRGPWRVELNNLAFDVAWQQWLYNADVARMDRVPALRGAIAVYLSASRSQPQSPIVGGSGEVERVGLAIGRALAKEIPMFSMPQHLSDAGRRIAIAALSALPQPKALSECAQQNLTASTSNIRANDDLDAWRMHDQS